MTGMSAEKLFFCLVCGVALGLVFALFEFFRLLFSLRRIAGAVLDIFFCLLSAVVTFLVSLAISGGQIRLLQMLCEALGFLCVQVTLTHGVCRFFPFARRRLRCIAAAVTAKRIRFQRKKAEALPKSRKKRGFFLNKTKKRKKRLE